MPHSNTGQVKPRCDIVVDLADIGAGKSATQLQYEVTWLEDAAESNENNEHNESSTPTGPMTKTVVVLQEEDYFDPESGLMHQAW